MLCRGRWKLTLYHGYERPQLFDLESDPDEARDLAEDPAHARLRDELLASVRRDWRGDWVQRTVERQRQDAQLMARWRETAQPGVTEVWTVPDGCNRRDPE